MARGERRGARRGQGRGGLSLIEMMVSLAVLGITISSFISATYSVSQIFYHQRMLTQAIAVGESLTESLLLLAPSDDELQPGTYQRYFSSQGMESSKEGAAYIAEYEVRPYTAVAGIRELEIRIRWQEKGVPKSLSWLTYRN